jgi:hypothetical protein
MNKEKQIFAVAISSTTNFNYGRKKKPPAWGQQDATNQTGNATTTNMAGRDF